MEKLSIPPGLITEWTPYAAYPAWVDGDKIRFRYGRVEKIGGWAKLVSTQIKGFARDVHSWVALDGKIILAIGTSERLYVYIGGVLSDITPLDESGTLNNPLFTEGIGTNTVKVNDTAHGRVVGDTVIFTGAPFTWDGVTLPAGELTVLAVIDANNYRVQGTGSATAGNTQITGQPTMAFQYLLGIGNLNASIGTGYGIGPYNSSTYGTPRVITSGAFTESRTWTMDNWGEDLIACPRGGFMYYWDSSTGVGTRAQKIEEKDNSDVGTGFFPRALNVLVTFNRQLVMFGSQDTIGTGIANPMRIRWSDDNRYAVFASAETNKAGSILMNAGSKIVSTRRTAHGILIWTDSGLYLMSLILGKLIYRIDELAANAGCVGPHASVENNGRAFWMGHDNFLYYNGTVQIISCPVRNRIWGDINDQQLWKVYTGYNAEFQEFVVFYPSSLATEPDRYAIYNAEENHWTLGTLARTVWHDSQFSQHQKPVAVGTDRYIYSHETGYDADGQPITAFVESGFLEINNGDDLALLTRLIPDLTVSGDVNVTIKYREYPNGAELTRGPYTVNAGVERIDTRARGRQFSFRWESSGQDASWRLGDCRVLITPDGRGGTGP